MQRIVNVHRTRRFGDHIFKLIRLAFFDDTGPGDGKLLPPENPRGGLSGG